MRTVQVYALASLMLLTPAGTPVSAQSEAPCLEGRSASGACVDATMGSLMRESIRVYTQPRLSYSGYPIVPSGDRRYDATRDWGQGLSREMRGPCVVNFCP